jgi:hypothetical protein
VSEQDLEALRLIAANKPDSEIYDALARDGVAAPQVRYVVAAARQRFEDLVRQSQGRLDGQTSPFSVAQQLAGEAGLPTDLAEQIAGQAHVRARTIHQREQSVPLERRAKLVAGVIGIVVFVIIIVAVHAGSIIAEVIGLVAGAAIYFIVLTVMRRYEAQKRI